MTAKQRAENLYKMVDVFCHKRIPDFCLLRFVPRSARFYSGYKLEDFMIDND